MAKTLRQREGIERAQEMIEKEIGSLSEFCIENDLNLLVSIGDAGGDPDSEKHMMSVCFGPDIEGGLNSLSGAIQKFCHLLETDSAHRVLDFIQETIDAERKDLDERQENTSG